MNNPLSPLPEAGIFPACYVEIPSDGSCRRAAFYLAAEEYVADHFPEDRYLFTWQVSPTVVMGRNQVAHLELDLDFCRREGIDVVRRKSGGGSIYADEGNIMVSVITGPGAVEPLFNAYAAKVAGALCGLGAAVTVSGRNDITLDGGGKICGNAFYHRSDRNIVHGTMLYDTDRRLMSGALTPEKAKLQAKGVVSVKSRIALLKDVLQLPVAELRDTLRQQLTDRVLTLGEQDVRRIVELEQEYYRPAYLYGRSAQADAEVNGRIEGCGSLSLHFFLKGSRIERVEVKGDYFSLDHVEQRFAAAFCGRAFMRSSLLEGVRQLQPATVIRGLQSDALCRLLETLFTDSGQNEV